MSMFGDLFGEEDDSTSYGSSRQSGHGNSDHVEPREPPRVRGTTGLAGIANQGATCYLNSLLQTLLFTPEFRESLFDLGQDVLGAIKDKEKQGSKVRIIPINLQRLFARLLVLNQRSASTEELTDSFGWANNEELQQHDVQELNRILFCAIEDSLVGTSGEHLISRLYRGTVVNQISCEVCNRISEREEEFLDLTLAVGGYVGVQDTLRANYVEEEKMEGSNQYRCDRCKTLVNARKGAKIRTLPPILTLSLLRFSYDFVKLERYKETGHYTFPMELDMSPYCEHRGNKAMYELYSVVLHSGSTHGGHYHAYIRDIDSLGNWLEPENELILLSSDAGSTKDDIIDMKSPQQCLVSLLRKHGGRERAMAVDRLCQVLNQETGVSWNKRFKRQYGTFIKFLKKYSDIFELNVAGTIVHLVDPMKSQASSHPSSLTSNEDSNRGERGRKGDHSEGMMSKDLSNREKAIARAIAALPEPGHCWYDFNDSSISPIRERALGRQFQGRESAYMLLYRCKSLQRPRQAYNNPYLKMPPWLMAEVETANQEHEKQREEYDREVNRVELTVLLATHYTWARGGLQRLSDVSDEPIALSLDRRKTVRHLMALIREQVPEKAANLPCLHVAKELPAGVHLFDAITDDVDKTLQENFVQNGTKLFLWDGAQVSGESILVGSRCEPVLLLITYASTNAKGLPPEDPGVKETPYGFPKDTKLSEFRCMVSKIIHIPLRCLALSRVQTSRPVVLREEDDSRTLAQMEFVDGDGIIVEATEKWRISGGDSPAGQEAERQQSSIPLTVENRCADPSNDGGWPAVRVDIARGNTVAELKQMIINRLRLYGNHHPRKGCRLRISDNSLGLLPPLHENQSLEDAGIKRNKVVVIEAGLPPTSTQLTINFTLTTGTKSWDVLLDKSVSVTECLTKMLEVAGITNSLYHLRKTNWCGEAANIITDADCTLLELGIRDGELLMLEEGRLPPKGFVLLPIWLYPPPNKGGCCGDQVGGAVSWITQQFSNILFSLTSATQNSTESGTDRIAAQNALLGEMEISQDASVAELKSQVQTLPAMREVEVPTVGFLRVRLLEDGRLGRVLRDNNQSLKYAKVVSSSHIAVQILTEEEHLRQTEYVLAIQQRIPETRTYKPPEELIWDAEKSAAPDSLRQAIADHMLLPMERITIAKHLSTKYDWLLIPEEKKTVDAGKGRGSGGKRKGKGHLKPISLKHGPYMIRDGDVIGVVDLQFDALREDNFTTVEDDKGRRRLWAEEDAKKRRRKDRRNAISVGEDQCKERRKKQEVGLSIRVDDFR